MAGWDGKSFPPTTFPLSHVQYMPHSPPQGPKEEAERSCIRCTFFSFPLPPGERYIHTPSASQPRPRLKPSAVLLLQKYFERMTTLYSFQKSIFAYFHDIASQRSNPLLHPPPPFSRYLYSIGRGGGAKLWQFASVAASLERDREYLLRSSA